MSDDLDKVIGGNVSKWRAARGYSQTELAEQLEKHGFKCTQQTVARIESGARPLRVSETRAFQWALRMSPADMLQHDTSKTEAMAQLIRAGLDVERALGSLSEAAVRLQSEMATGLHTLYFCHGYRSSPEYAHLYDLVEVPVLELVEEKLVEAHLDADKDDYVLEQSERMKYEDVRVRALQHLKPLFDDTEA